MIPGTFLLANVSNKFSHGYMVRVISSGLMARTLQQSIIEGQGQGQGSLDSVSIRGKVLCDLICCFHYRIKFIKSLLHYVIKTLSHY